MRGIRLPGSAVPGENDTVLSTLGAEPRRGDFFDAASLRNIIAGCDVVMHLATAIPKKILVRKGDWLLNDRLRTEGTRNLAEAALANACRLGWLYSADAFHIRSLVGMMKERKYKSIGEGKQYWSLIHADDAASAFIKAVENLDNIARTAYNVVDDGPVLVRELIAHIAKTLGIKEPGKLPIIFAKPLLGADVVDSFLVSARVKNDAVKTDLGWESEYKTFREGYTAVIREMELS